MMWTAEWKVPPENDPLAMPNPRSVIGTSSGSWETVNRAPRSQGIESKPHECTIRAPLSFADSVVAQIHQVDELGLAGQVDVISARGGACGNERLAVEDVGPDR